MADSSNDSRDPMEPPPNMPAPALQNAPQAVRRSMPMALSITVGLLAAAVIGWFFYEIIWFILLLYLSLVIATILDWPVVWLKRHGVNRTLATVLIMFSIVLVGAGAIYFISITIYSQITALSANMREIPKSIQHFLNMIANHFPGLADRLKYIDVQEKIADAMPGIDTILKNAVNGFALVSYAVIAFFTVMYMLIEGPDALLGIRRIFPKRARLEVQEVFREAAHTHRAWFIASAVNVASSTIMTSLGLWLLGIPGAPILGFIAGLGELVPNVGPFFGALPTLLLVLVTNPHKFLWVVGMFLIVQTIQSYTITPLIMKVGVRMPVLVTIISVLVMGTLFGALGVFVAIPLTADLIVLWNVVNRRLETDEGPGDLANAPPDTRDCPPTETAPKKFHILRRSTVPPSSPPPAAQP